MDSTVEQIEMKDNNLKRNSTDEQLKKDIKLKQGSTDEQTKIQLIM